MVSLYANSSSIVCRSMEPVPPFDSSRTINLNLSISPPAPTPINSIALLGYLVQLTPGALK